MRSTAARRMPTAELRPSAGGAAVDNVRAPDQGPAATLQGVPMRRHGVSFGALLWLIIGLVVALSNGYGITNFSSLISFLLALFLWPLVLLGVSLHLQF
jgi:hypothetical protein